MDAVMVGRMERLGGQHFADQGLGRQATADRRAAIVVVPHLPKHERLGFQLVGKMIVNVFPAAEQFAAALAIVLRAAAKVALERVDPLALSGAGFLFALDRFGQKRLGSLVVVEVRHRHAPVGHGTVGIECRGLPERALGFVVPEAVQLPEPLVEELLGQR